MHSEKAAPTPLLPGIQLLRGMAALGVVVHHTLELTNGSRHPFAPKWTVTAGAAGVDLFFVISGFIMVWTNFAPDRRIRTPFVFLLERAKRIYPLYWVFLVAIVLIWSAGFLKNQNWGYWNIFNSALLMPDSRQVIFVAWTLIFEILFYIVFAVMLSTRSRTVCAIGSSAALLMIMSASALLPPGPYKTVFADPITLEFIAGIWIAVFFRTFQPKLKGYWLVAIAGVLMIATAGVALPQTGPPNQLNGWYRVFGWGLPAALIVLALVPLSSAAAPLLRWCLHLGDASYALYLSHVFIMLGYGRLLKQAGFQAIPQQGPALVVIGLCIGLALVSHRYLELPLSRLLRFNLPDKPGVPEQA